MSQAGEATLTEGENVDIQEKNGATVLNWEVTSSRRVAQMSNGLTVYMLSKTALLFSLY